MNNAAPMIDQPAAPVVQGVVKPVDLARYKEVIANMNNPEYSLEGQMNLACWLGERAHLLVAEIEALREPIGRDLELARLQGRSQGIQVALDIIEENLTPTTAGVIRRLLLESV